MGEAHRQHKIEGFLSFSLGLSLSNTRAILKHKECCQFLNEKRSFQIRALNCENMERAVPTLLFSGTQVAVQFCLSFYL